MHHANARPEPERLYGKDAICPPAWHKWLMESGLPDMLKPGGTEDVLELLPDTVRKIAYTKIKY